MNTIVSELSMNDLNSKFFDIIQNENNAEDAANFIFDSVCEDVTLGVLFEVHHGIKTGLTELLEGEKEDEEQFKIVNSPECDVFGFSILKKTPDANCSCPNCERPVSATRFAPHLEKCMGMGRNSSRIASRRIASNSREPTSYAGLPSDDEDDADWSGTLHSERRKRRMKSSNKRNSKIHKSNNGNHNSENNDGATYETMSANEKKNLLLQICGVVSEHTKKLCTRSTRCPQHSEEQRRALRNNVLEPSTPESQSMGLTADDAGSPPDSSPSSSCSSSSRKRDRHRAVPRTKNKREKLSPLNGRD
ncbi:SAGA-associated factor 11 homolog [Pararge aegeria]|uniref:SAGA-associated factor 11 homolog n=3 Tax=Pararge aegeria TaxID=116150 RepID=A0A8S4S098_9NEOP|nr:SAGA-associated factor 11 homolog [Pararge aegeria]CAH2242995.1 jg19437 [Pararge aegeria aegeria]